MTDAVKWGLLATAFVSVLVTIWAFVYQIGAFSAVNEAVASFGGLLDDVVGYLDLGKRLLNNLFFPWALNLGIAVALFAPLVKFSITIALGAFHWIYK